MSVYNGAAYVQESIESMLGQTFTDFEFIIIDDGSSDATPKILAEYAARDGRIILVRNECNLGLTRSLNKGLRLAQGRYIARQDADDVSLPSRLEQQVRLLDQHPEVAVVGSAYYVVNEEGRSMRVCCHPVSDTAIRWRMFFYCSFAHSSVMLRAGLLREKGLQYNEEMIYAQDYEFWSRLLCFGKGLNIPVPLVKYRSHEAQVGSVYVEQQRATADRIARANMAALGISVSDEEVRTLRQWYHNWPRRLHEEDLLLCVKLLHLLHHKVKIVTVVVDFDNIKS